MAVSNRTDLDEVGRCLTGWLAARLPDASGIAVSGVEIPAASGFSCETIRFDAAWTRDATLEGGSFVARVAPADGAGLFPSYDLDSDAMVMRALSGHTDIPAPRVPFLESDPAVLGGPFLVMEHIAGRVPPDDPPYPMQGWVVDLPLERQRALVDNAVATIAAVARVDWSGLGLGKLARVGLDQQLAFLERLYSTGSRGVPQPVVIAGLQYLRANTPRAEPLALSWGDARLGNMIFREDCSLAGALDWELAAIASPEQDIAYFLYALRLWSEGYGVASPQGFPSREEILSRFERLSGHSVENLDYYERYSAVFAAILVMRAGNLMIDAGMLPPDSTMPALNPAVVLLADYLDMPAPTGQVTGWAGKR